MRLFVRYVVTLVKVVATRVVANSPYESPGYKVLAGFQLRTS